MGMIQLLTHINTKNGLEKITEDGCPRISVLEDCFFFATKMSNESLKMGESSKFLLVDELKRG